MIMINRRTFFSRVFKTVAAVALPITVLSYDPVRQAVLYPKVENSCLLGYKGSSFLEAGIVYAPYIPLYQTCNLNKSSQYYNKGKNEIR
jgi:hypothetical protein